MNVAMSMGLVTANYRVVLYRYHFVTQFLWVFR